MKLFKEAFSPKDLDYHMHMADKHEKIADDNYEKMKKSHSIFPTPTDAISKFKKNIEDHMDAAKLHYIAKRNSKDSDAKNRANDFSKKLGVKYG